MIKHEILSYIHALRPILYIPSHDFHAVDNELREIIGRAEVKEFCEGLGAVDFKTKSRQAECTLSEFLNQYKDEGYDKETFLLLKDVHGHLLNDAPGHQLDLKVMALLKYISERTIYWPDYQQTVIIVSGELAIPKELEHFITIIPQELPDQKKIEDHIRAYAEDQGFAIGEGDIGELALELKGFSIFQVKQVLNLAYANSGEISISDRELILAEKKQLIHKSGLLEYIEVDEQLISIGGLEGLKEWLRRKAKIFHHLDAALKNGVDLPKGILMLGFPGCGKSLTAKATASEFEVPLIRLDVGKILGKYVGESERNMRAALAQAEAISPCVLWIDEIEKAFSTGANAHEVTTRLVGHFLTWMQEKTSTVFVVATANDLERLPTEFLRKGRFDEIFFVDLPIPQERLQILKIHLKKRKQYDSALDISSIVENTKDFSGADLEAGVAIAVEDNFLKQFEENKNNSPATVSADDLSRAFSMITPLSKALEKKFKDMKEKLKEYNLRPAQAQAKP